MPPLPWRPDEGSSGHKSPQLLPAALDGTAQGHRRAAASGPSCAYTSTVTIPFIAGAGTDAPSFVAKGVVSPEEPRSRKLKSARGHSAAIACSPERKQFIPGGSRHVWLARWLRSYG